MKPKIIAFSFCVALLLTSCFTNRLKEKANAQFGDQYFKTAISLIELYKTREGDYPAVLDSIKYAGDWDKMAFASVQYKKLDDGYELNLINGWMGKPTDLSYPADFWKGLGLKKSNMKKDEK